MTACRQVGLHEPLRASQMPRKWLARAFATHAEHEDLICTIPCVAERGACVHACKPFVVTSAKIANIAKSANIAKKQG
jgi:hypothetical protein